MTILRPASAASIVEDASRVSTARQTARAAPPRKPIIEAMRVAGLGLALTTPPWLALADTPNEVRRFDISAGPLDRALTRFARQAGVPLAVNAELTASLDSPGVHGDLAVPAALQRLLSGTGIKAVWDRRGEYTFRKASTLATADEGEVTVELETLTVTATKSDREIGQVPASISIRDREQMDVQGVRDANEALIGITGTEVTTFSGTTGNISMRGITSPQVFNSNILVALDGVPQTYIGDELITTELPFVGVDRVEVIRGPVSMLHGRNALAGVVNYVMKRPSWTQEGSVRLDAGSEGYYSPQFLLTSPITDNLAYLVTASYQHTDGWRDETELDRTDAFGSLTWRPTANDEITFMASYLDYKNLYATELALDRNGDILPQKGGHEANYNLPNGRSEKEVARVWIDWDHTFNPSLKLKVLTYYKTVEGGLRNDGAVIEHDPEDSTITQWGLLTNGDGNDFFMEPRLTWDAELFGRKNQLLVGVSYQRLWGDTETYFLEPALWEPFTYDRITGERAHSPIEARLTSLTEYTGTYGSFYGQNSFHLTPEAILDVGARYDYYERDVDYKAVGSKRARQVKGDFTHLSPKLALTYRLRPELSAYALYSQGFHPSFGPMWNYSEDYAELDPEIANNYELGLRGYLFEKLLYLQLAGFLMEREDLVVFAVDIMGRGGSPRNAGKQDIWGIELETRFDLHRIVPGLSGFFNYAYYRPEWKSYVYDEGGVRYDFSGKQPVLTPDHIGNFGLSYRHAATGLGVNGWINYVGRRWVDPSNRFSLGPYNTVNLSLDYLPPDLPTWEASIRFLNVFDEEYLSAVSFDEQGAIGGHLGAPRSVLATVQYYF